MIAEKVSALDGPVWNEGSVKAKIKYVYRVHQTDILGWAVQCCKEKFSEPSWTH